MAIYYLDVSALVKRYLWEPGSHWLRALLAKAGPDGFASTELITVEVICALARAERESRIGRTARDKLSRSQFWLTQRVPFYLSGFAPLREIRDLLKLAKLFFAEAESLLDAAPVSADVLQNAHDLALRHPLRAYDAVHLATALTMAQHLLWHDLPAPIFVSADENLLAAARAEGLAAENPSEHEG